MDQELKDYLEEKFAAVDNRFTMVATKDVIKAVLESIDDLARMVESGFEDMQQRLDVTDRVRAVERDLVRIKEALHISPST